MVFKEHPSEIRQEDKVPVLAATIWEWHWPTPSLIGPCFGLWQKIETGLVSSMFRVKTLCLEEPPSEVKLDDGSHLNVMDDSDLK